MWILTQNRQRILSTDSLAEIRVAYPKAEHMDFVIMMSRRIDGKEFALGFYRDKEKAAGILEDIIKEQAAWKNCEGRSDVKTGTYQPAYAIVPPKTFIMPQDSEE